MKKPWPLASMQSLFCVMVWNCFLILMPGCADPGNQYPTLPYSELQLRPKVLPYVRIYGSDRRLIVFGSNHSNRPDDPQMGRIDSFISHAKPQLILYEGDGIARGRNKTESVQDYFEMGLALYLADSLGIAAQNIEPDTREKYRLLLRDYTRDEILIATLGLQITFLQMENQPLEDHFAIMVNDLVREGLPLNSEQRSLTHFKKVYQEYFGRAFNYRTFDSRDIQAKYNRTIFNRINRAANQFRDQHMLRLTDRELRRGKKVFLLVGGWHAIVCEPAFSAMTAEAQGPGS